MKRILAGFIFASLFLLILVACDDHGITPVQPKVIGDVVFEGEWPNGVVLAFVVLAYDRPPGDSLKFEYLATFQDIPFNDKPDSFQFELTALPDTYRWLIVAVVTNPLNIGAHNVVGEYIDPNNPDEPGIIHLGHNEIFDAGTIYVDFDEVDL
jgi:hypothetical protein